MVWVRVTMCALDKRLGQSSFLLQWRNVRSLEWREGREEESAPRRTAPSGRSPCRMGQAPESRVASNAQHGDTVTGL